MIFKAIETKYFGPNNVKGSRIKAWHSGGKSVTVSYDCAVSADRNHWIAAQELIAKMSILSGGGWHGQWVQGETAKGHVFVKVS
jgi:hypothetical protein